MSINIFRTGGASAFSRVYNFFSPAPKADSLVDKVLKLFMAIILAPVSAVKYSAGFVTSSFKKENPKTTSEKLAFAANTAVSQIKKAVESSENFVVKNQSTIIKVVIAAAVVTGAVYAYRLQTQPDDSRVPDGGGSFLGKVLFGGSLAGVALGIVYAATADLRADLRADLSVVIKADTPEAATAQKYRTEALAAIADLTVVLNATTPEAAIAAAAKFKATTPLAVLEVASAAVVIVVENAEATATTPEATAAAAAAAASLETLSSLDSPEEFPAALAALADLNARIKAVSP